MTSAHPVNWGVIVLKLNREFKSYRRLGQAAGTGRRAMQNLAYGKSHAPRFDHALRLLALYNEHVEPVPGVLELAKALEVQPK